MTRGEKLCFEYGQAAALEGLPFASCYDPQMHNMVSESRTKRGQEYNSRNMMAWSTGYLKAYLERGSLIDSSMFRSCLIAFLPEFQSDAANGWTQYAEQRIASGEYIDNEIVGHEIALSRWHESLLAGLLDVKHSFGPAVATELCNLGASGQCLYPCEMNHAARLLSEGTDVAQFGQMREYKLTEAADASYPQLSDVWEPFDSVSAKQAEQCPHIQMM